MTAGWTDTYRLRENPGDGRPASKLFTLVRAVTLILAVGLSASVITAQATARRIATRASCAACVIEITPLLRLGSPQDPVLLSPFPGPVRDSRGRFFAASVDRKQVVVFDAKGAFLTVFGRAGQGPGEISAIPIARLSVGRGDTLFVQQGPRVTAFDPSFKAGAVTRLPVTDGFQLQALPSGELLIAATIHTPTEFGIPFHALNRNGVIVRSIGDGRINHHLAYGQPYEQAAPPPRFVMAPDSQSIWIGPAGRIRQLFLNGRQGTAFDVIHPAWFPAVKDTVLPDREGKLAIKAILGAGHTDLLAVDREGIAWMQTSISERPGRQRRRLLSAIDIKSATFLSEADITAKTATSGLAPVGGDLVYQLSENVDGIVTFAISRLVLRRG